nr:multidrug resistance-associated protein 5 [Tanacetum cinerariifolium]
MVASTSRATTSNKNEVLVEHDVFIANLVRKMKGEGKDYDLQDPFVGVKETKDIYPTHEDPNELKDCLSCYALSNGYSIWYERSSADQVIIVYGQRPPTLKEPSLGKQRKQI